MYPGVVYRIQVSRWVSEYMYPGGVNRIHCILVEYTEYSILAEYTAYMYPGGVYRIHVSR